MTAVTDIFLLAYQEIDENDQEAIEDHIFQYFISNQIFKRATFWSWLGSFAFELSKKYVQVASTFHCHCLPWNLG